MEEGLKRTTSGIPFNSNQKTAPKQQIGGGFNIYDGKDGGIWVTIEKLLKSKGKCACRKIGIHGTFWGEYPLVNQTSDEKIDEGSNWKLDFQKSHPETRPPLAGCYSLENWHIYISGTNFRPHCRGKQLDVHLLVLQVWCTFLPFCGPAPESLRQSHAVPLHDSSAHVLVASFRSLAPMAARVLVQGPSRSLLVRPGDAQLLIRGQVEYPYPSDTLSTGHLHFPAEGPVTKEWTSMHDPLEWSWRGWYFCRSYLWIQERYRFANQNSWGRNWLENLPYGPWDLERYSWTTQRYRTLMFVHNPSLSPEKHAL